VSRAGSGSSWSLDDETAAAVRVVRFPCDEPQTFERATWSARGSKEEFTRRCAGLFDYLRRAARTVSSCRFRAGDSATVVANWRWSTGVRLGAGFLQTDYLKRINRRARARSLAAPYRASIRHALAAT
jgi:hypothetical protein